MSSSSQRSLEKSETREVEWTDVEEKHLVTKIDARCMPVLIILFILNFIDRGGLANARLQGLQKDLNLDDTQYATTLSIFFAGYISMQLPANLVMNAVPHPRYFMSAVVTVWGVISALTSLCHNFHTLTIVRFFLGFVEASFYPCSIYYLSRWYTRKEVGFRVAVLNAGNMLAQGLGGLLAAGILTGMDGTRGIAGWRWLFIIEGSITIGFGLLVPFFLADYPSSTKWLSDRQRYIAQARLVKDIGLTDNPDENEKHASGIIQGIVLAVKDIKVWIMALTYISFLIGLSFSQYMPSITKTLGFNTTITLLLTFPPWAFATIFALYNSWHSDRTEERFFHIALSYGFAILGYIIAATSKSIPAKYFSLFCMCMGYSGGIILLGWVPSCLPRPPVKRAAAIAIINAFGNIGQIPGAYLFPSKWAPSYWQSFTSEICILTFSLMVVFGYRQYLISLNKKLDQGEARGYIASAAAIEKSANLVHTSVTEEEALVKKFRYIY